MADKLTQAARKIGQTKRNSEAALRRYNVKHPKIDRVRDIFDNVVPFEMDFETEPNETLMFINLSFNKPPPVSCSCGIKYKLLCEEHSFDAGSGHLIQVTYFPYEPGSVSVFINGDQLSTSQYTEYDPSNGLVNVVGTVVVPQMIVNVCYTWDSEQDG